MFDFLTGATKEKVITAKILNQDGSKRYDMHLTDTTITFSNYYTPIGKELTQDNNYLYLDKFFHFNSNPFGTEYEHSTGSNSDHSTTILKFSVSDNSKEQLSSLKKLMVIKSFLNDEKNGLDPKTKSQALAHVDEKIKFFSENVKVLHDASAWFNYRTKYYDNELHFEKSKKQPNTYSSIWHLSSPNLRHIITITNNEFFTVQTLHRESSLVIPANPYMNIDKFKSDENEKITCKAENGWSKEATEISGPLNMHNLQILTKLAAHDVHGYSTHAGTVIRNTTINFETDKIREKYKNEEVASDSSSTFTLK